MLYSNAEESIKKDDGFLYGFFLILQILPLKNITFKKSHICNEGGTPQNFFLTFTDELQKQIFIKNVEMGQ